MKKLIGLLPVLLMCSLTANAAGTIKNNQESPKEKTQATFAVKGGISLGSYEAGVNWVLMEQIRLRGTQLNTFTGASAGGINAIISAVQFCKENVASTVKKNLYREAWDVGIRDLAPLKGTAQFDYSDIISNLESLLKNPDSTERSRDKGGVFSRRGLLRSIRVIYNEIAGKKDFRNGCEVNIGLAVTKLNPEFIEVEGLTIKNQRYIVPMRVITRNKQLYFENLHPANEEFTYRDSYLYLPENENGTIPVHEVMKLALASSAFPVAFAPVNLEYCQQVKDKTFHDKLCPKGYQGKNALFTDGGSFDNAPIGSALNLSRVHPGNNDASNKVIGYINPGKLRERAGKSDDSSEIKNRRDPNTYIAGISDYTKLAVQVFDYGSNAELYKSIRRLKHDRSKERFKFYSTSRFYPLVGDHLIHFAAFFDKAFRRFDFSVGVYDGVINLARYYCINDQGFKFEQLEDREGKLCIGKVAGKLFTELKVGEGDGVDVFAAVAMREFSDLLDQPEWRWINVKEIIAASSQTSENMDIMKALVANECKDLTQACKRVTPVTFIEFLGALDHEKGYENFTKNMIVSPDKWQYPLLSVAFKRLNAIENKRYDYLVENDEEDEAFIQKGVLLGMKPLNFFSRTAIIRQENNFWPRNTTSQGKWYQPDEVGLDSRNSGVYLSYSLNEVSVFGPSSSWVVETNFIPLHSQNRQGRVEFESSSDFVVRYHRDSPIISSLGFGGILYYDWEDRSDKDIDRFQLGVKVDVGLLGDKVRLAIHHRDVPSEEGQWAIMIGLSDFKSVLNW